MTAIINNLNKGRFYILSKRIEGLYLSEFPSRPDFGIVLYNKLDNLFSTIESAKITMGIESRSVHYHLNTNSYEIDKNEITWINSEDSKIPFLKKQLNSAKSFRKEQEATDWLLNDFLINICDKIYTNHNKIILKNENNKFEKVVFSQKLSNPKNRDERPIEIGPARIEFSLEYIIL